MWFPHRPQATDAERAILRFLAPLAVLFVLGLLAWQSCQSFNRERQAKKDVVAACMAAGSTILECKAKLKERGDLCWDRHYFPGSKGVRPNLAEAAYRECILQPEAAPQPSP